MVDDDPEIEETPSPSEPSDEADEVTENKSIFYPEGTNTSSETVLNQTDFTGESIITSEEPIESGGLQGPSLEMVLVITGVMVCFLLLVFCVYCSFKLCMSAAGESAKEMSEAERRAYNKRRHDPSFNRADSIAIRQEAQIQESLA